MFLEKCVVPSLLGCFLNALFCCEGAKSSYKGSIILSHNYRKYKKNILESIDYIEYACNKKQDVCIYMCYIFRSETRNSNNHIQIRADIFIKSVYVNTYVN